MTTRFYGENSWFTRVVGVRDRGRKILFKVIKNELTGFLSMTSLGM